MGSIIIKVAQSKLSSEYFSVVKIMKYSVSLFQEEDTATTSTAAERQNNDNSDKESSAKGAKKAKNRCGVCRKKVGITGRVL